MDEYPIKSHYAIWDFIGLAENILFRVFLDGFGHVRGQTGGFWVWGVHFLGSQVTQVKTRRPIPVLQFLRMVENLESKPYTLPAFSGGSQKQNLTDLDV